MEKNKKTDFTSIKISLASPQQILEWSRGEVEKSETIDYRTQRAKPGFKGLFDEAIFGTEKNYECPCGRYRDIRYKGIICEKCGVQVEHSIVRRSRMGHIELATPVAHVWFLRTIPSKIATILGITHTDMKSIVYFSSYVVTKVDEEGKKKMLEELKAEYAKKVKSVKDATEKDKIKSAFQTRSKEITSLKKGLTIGEDKYYNYILRYSSIFEAEIGGEVVYKLLKDLDLKELEKELEERLLGASKGDTEKIQKRLSLVRKFIRSNTRPEWMFFTHLPVIPTGLRPIVPLDGGRCVTSDINDLYRRVINRNNRLKRLMSINSPEVILRNEKRILQEAVDSLLDSEVKSLNKSGVMNSQQDKKAPKSLANYLMGKKGYFRSNLLGKRVDYSGRSVIVSGPELRIDECGLPKEMALELFRTFVIAKILEKELAYNIRAAGRLIDEKHDSVWQILEEVIKGKYVLLNRAPTLHRQGIQAFKPILVESKAISFHPLACSAYNADFDGDSVSVHVPITEEAQFEAREIMSSTKNIINPGNGEIIASPNRQDMILGCYWMTKQVKGAKGEGLSFSNPNEAITVYELGNIDMRALIKVLPSDKKKYKNMNGKVFETTVGRLLFNTILPSDYPFINQHVTKGYISKIISDVISHYPMSDVLNTLDAIKRFGFEYATISGISYSISDNSTPKGKQKIIDNGNERSKKIKDQYDQGLLSEEERKRMMVEVWQGVRLQLEEDAFNALEEHNPVRDMIISGARGSKSDFNNITGIKGIIASAKGVPIEQPVIGCYKEGLNSVEYFIDGYGARKGFSDTALKTSESGYFGRKLFDVSQSVVVESKDCGSKTGINISRETFSGIPTSFAKRIKGRFLTNAVKDPDGGVIGKKGEYIDIEMSDRIEKEKTVDYVSVRSPINCKHVIGVCQTCYGDDLSIGKVVDIGEAVGTIAAQSIGEPGTQLTMNTIHSSGSLSIGGDIITGLPRVTELFERREPKNPGAVASVDGLVTEIKEVGGEKTIVISPKKNSSKK